MSPPPGDSACDDRLNHDDQPTKHTRPTSLQVEADSLEFLNLRMAALELRNSYLVAYDLLAKNMDKLQASNQNFSSRMVV